MNGSSRVKRTSGIEKTIEKSPDHSLMLQTLKLAAGTVDVCTS
jgi:hypothetical protein